MLYRTLSFFCFWFLVINLEGQSIDSLRKLLTTNIDSDKRIEVLHRLAMGYENIDLDSAKMYALTADALDIENDSARASLYHTLGIICSAKGEYDEALGYMLDALRLAESEEITYLEIAVRVNIGTIYDRQSNYDRAEAYYLEAIRLLNQENTWPNKSIFLANIYNNLANVYGNRGDTVKMMTYYDDALVHANATSDAYMQSMILNNIGNIELNQGNFGKAYRHILASLKIRQESENMRGIAQSYRNLGYYYNNTDQWDSAIVSFRRSMAVARRVGSLAELVEAKEGISHAFEARGNYRESLEAYKEYKRLSDSLYNERKLSEIARIESAYEFEQRQAEARSAQLVKERRFYIILSILGATSLILALLIVIQRNRMKSHKMNHQRLLLEQKSLELEKENLNMKLDYKNKEMTTKVLYMYKKNELVDNVIKQLSGLMDNLKQENKPVVKKVIKSLSQALNEDSWKEFELRFNEIHHDFYEKLERDFPELTPNERKLCAFLKLNMTSKEISSLTGQSIRSIDVARTRLRKKLNLTNTETTLVDFLTHI